MENIFHVDDDAGTKVSIKNQELRYSQDKEKPVELVQDEFWYYII